MNPRDHDGLLDAVSAEAVDSAQLGRREAHKRATRAAISAAAEELIARQGFAATTVRQIADAAQVTERTFYRYFDGKEGLVAAEMSAWMQALHDAILARPLDEPAARAVRCALISLVEAVTATPRARLLWAFSDNPGALKSMRRAGTRPLLRLEGLITQALLARTDRAAADQPDRFTCELIARTAVAVLRTIGSERRRGQETLDPAVLIARAFDAVADLFADGGAGANAHSSN